MRKSIRADYIQSLIFNANSADVGSSRRPLSLVWKLNVYCRFSSAQPLTLCSYFDVYMAANAPVLL